MTSRSLAAGLALLLAGCGVKAPPRPPERGGLPGSPHDLRPERAAPPDGGAPDGGDGR